MTDYTPILNIAEVASAQNQKEATINTGFAILEASMNDANIVSLASASHALSVDEYTKWLMQRCQGHSVARNLDTPAASGTFTGKRFFIVSNEGTATVTVRPGGSGTGTIAVAAGKIVLIQSDGTTLRAVSSGVALLTDLSDVDVTTIPPTNGQVLKFNSVSGKWVAGDFSAGTFTALSDTPANYTSAGLELVRVKSTTDGLEFWTFPVPAAQFVSGRPTSSQLVMQHLFLVTTKLPSALTGSYFKVNTLPTATTVYDVQKNGVSVGSISFATSGVATVTFTGSVTFAPGDALQVVAPSSRDTTAADFTFAFLANFA